jgi:hypothetical protein
MTAYFAARDAPLSSGAFRECTAKDEVRLGEASLIGTSLEGGYALGSGPQGGIDTA